MRKKILPLMIMLCAFLTVSGEERNGAMLWPFDVTPGYVSGMSDNGKWGVFKRPDYDEINAIPYRMNLTTGKIEEMPLQPQYKVAGAVCKCIDITDDGEMIVGSYNDLPAYYKNEAWHVLPIPKGLRGFYGPVCSVTPDGSWMVAWITQSFTCFRPIIWHNNEIVEIGDLPDYDELYARGIIDKATLNEHKEKNQTPNYAFFKISADGKHILSGIDHNYPGWGCSYIVYHTDTKTYDWIADELIERGAFVSYAQMSNNGKWIGASVSSSHTNPDGSWDDVHTGVLYDVENKSFARGRGWGQLGDDGNFYNIKINDGDLSVGVDKILKEKYGIDFYATTGYDGIGTAFYISSDLRTMLCQPGSRNEAYSLTFPVEFSEAVKDINLLTEAEITPASGIQISKLQRMRVEFEYASNNVDGINAIVMCGAEKIAESIGVEKSGRSYDVYFKDIKLEEGKEYEVLFPEGMFVDGSKNGISKEFRVKYKGREDVAVSVQEVVPREGSKMMELSINNYITLDFGTDIKLSEGARCELFEKGSEYAICVLQVATDGRHVALYPAAARKLPLGKVYEVKLSAGSVTDINDENGNAEIVLEYEGTYVPGHGMVSSSRLFYDDFSNPNESLNHFLQYEGDHNTPIEDMQQWGFDRDNTPWNFSVRDDDDYNYCAASTSLYTPAGTSDNWLVIPMLNIDNEYEWLTFKSQCYYYNTHDKLKVIVWESDELLGGLDSATIERMRREGDVVYERTQDCGLSVDRLAGDWLNNEISLAAYKGKNIYIAFVDENYNSSVLFLDDIGVEYRGNYELQIEAPAVVISGDKCDIKGRINVLGNKEYKGIEAQLIINGESSAEKIEDNATLINRENPYELEFKDIRGLLPGSINKIELSVKLGEESQRVMREIKVMDYRIERKVLVEEGTGTWCGWCPEGFIALEELQKMYPGRVAEVSIHFNDALSVPSYASFHNFGAFPAGCVDRLGKELAPMVLDPEFGRLSLTSADGESTFADVVATRLEEPTEAEIKIVKAWYNDNGDALADLEVKYAMGNSEVHYNLLGVLTEYGVKAFQSNNLSGSDDPLAGEWGSEGGTVYASMPAVARAISCNSYYGEPGVLTEKPQTGKTYSYRLKIAIPETVEDREQLKIVAVIIDATNGEVVNCDMSGFLQHSGVDTMQGTQWKVESGRISYGDYEIDVYTPSGIRVENEGLKGLYIVRAISAQGDVKIRKIEIR